MPCTCSAATARLSTPFPASRSRCGISRASAAASRCMAACRRHGRADVGCLCEPAALGDLGLVAKNTAPPARRLPLTSSCTRSRATQCWPRKHAPGAARCARSCSTSTARGAFPRREPWPMRSPDEACVARGAGLAARGLPRAGAGARARHRRSPPARTSAGVFGFRSIDQRPVRSTSRSRASRRSAASARCCA